MRIPRLYCKQVLSSKSRLVLDKETSHYLCTVLRLKANRKLILFNGELSDEFGEYQAILIDANKKAAVIEVGDFINKKIESPLNIELACCLIKNDRFDWLLQKATELGVTSISPIISEFTDVKHSVKLSKERLEKKVLHWQQIVVSACEQSGRTQVPFVNTPIALTDWLSVNKNSGINSNIASEEARYLLHPYNAEPFTFCQEQKSIIKKIVLLVGPEGGLSNEEVAVAHDHNFTSVLVGPRILRAETAPLTALSILQHQLGDFT